MLRQKQTSWIITRALNVICSLLHSWRVPKPPLLCMLWIEGMTQQGEWISIPISAWYAHTECCSTLNPVHKVAIKTFFPTRRSLCLSMSLSLHLSKYTNFGNRSISFTKVEGQENHVSSYVQMATFPSVTLAGRNSLTKCFLSLDMLLLSVYI